MSNQSRSDARFDFGPKFCATFCSRCRAMTRNRGCQTCRSIFCKLHFSHHCSNGCVHSAQDLTTVPTQAVSLVVVGEGFVGKTSLVRRYTDKLLAANIPPTMGVDFTRVRLMRNGVEVVQSIFDTAGQECFRTLRPQYFERAAGVILVYDVTDARSFKKMQDWLAQVQRHAQEGVKLILIGNKADLENRVVEEARGKAFADEHGMLFFETSAKTGLRVHDAFVTITDAILRQRSESRD